jgi:peptidyl-Asp metalloendopeptidase
MTTIPNVMENDRASVTSRSMVYPTTYCYDAISMEIDTGAPLSMRIVVDALRHNHLFKVYLVSSLICLLWAAFPGALHSQQPGATDLFKPIPIAKAGVLPADQEKQLVRIRDMQTTLDLCLAEVRENLFQSKSVTLNVSPDMPFRAETELVEKRSTNDLTWVGRIPDATVPGEAIMVMKDGRVNGIIQAGAELYEVVPLDSGRHVIVHVDQSKFPLDEPAPTLREMLESPPATEDAFSQKANRYRPSAEDEPDPSKVYPLRVIVAYTPAAKKAAGGQSDIESKIQLAVAGANKSYQNSKINIKMELAHCYETNYVETGKAVDDLKRFTEKNDGHLDEVHALRQQYSANVAVLLVSKMDSCGRAAAIGAEANQAFCVVLLQCLANHSFAHEIGHLQGAQHDWEAHLGHQKEHPAGHGYWHKGNEHAENWSTVMSYGCAEGCPRRLYWSNPDVSIKGVPTGTKECCNNAAVLRTTAKKMSTFK